MKNIVCDGFWFSDGNYYDVNLSSIWSYLIRECGKLVEDYNSDLIYDINSITKFVRSEDEKSRTFWIGLRESGVDHEEFITSRCKNDYYYRGVYKITVEKTNRKCVVTLEKSSAYEYRKEHNIVC